MADTDTDVAKDIDDLPDPPPFRSPAPVASVAPVAPVTTDTAVVLEEKKFVLWRKPRATTVWSSFKVGTDADVLAGGAQSLADTEDDYAFDLFKVTPAEVAAVDVMEHDALLIRRERTKLAE